MRAGRGRQRAGSGETFTARTRETEFDIGRRVEFGRRVVFGPNCRRVRIGFGTYLGDDLYIDVPELVVGDYSKIHRGGLLYGYQPMRIGHNCWVGQISTIDRIGTATIGNNVCVGALSQLWSHMKFGDRLAGCRWSSERPLVLEDDAWLGGHCVVAPVRVGRGAMLLAGGVATHDLEANHVYAGVPARDITRKVGPQFARATLRERCRRFAELYREFLEAAGLSKEEFRAVAVDGLAGKHSSGRETLFCLRDRTYLPSRSKNEYRFMRFLLYDRAKFVPWTAGRGGAGQVRRQKSEGRSQESEGESQDSSSAPAGPAKGG